MVNQQKVKIAYISEYLMQYTDEEHPATGTEILDYLASKGIEISRQALYGDLDALEDIGLDIQTVRMGPTTGYFIGERDFQLPELKLLVDAVQSSKFITAKKSMELIEKLGKLVSVHQAAELRHQVWVRGRVKTMNESIYYNVDKLHSAMEGDHDISFRYFTWNPQKEQVFRRDGERYIASPWALLLDNENYYLLAYENGSMKHFRVDKMVDIRIENILRRKGAEMFSELNMAAYTDAHFGMFSGESTPVKLCFHNSLAGVAIDFFGSDAIMSRYDDDHFTITVDVAVNIQFFGWLAGLGDKARIMAPQCAVDGMKAHIASMAALYEDNKSTHPLRSLLKKYDSILFVDTETTGFEPDSDTITEIAVIKVRSNGSVERDDFYVQQPEGKQIPQEITELTGITDEMCQGGLSQQDAAARFRSMLDNRTLFIAYNAQFDASFLTALADPLDVDYLDHLTVFRDRSSGPHKLIDAEVHYGLLPHQQHRAAQDVQSLWQITMAMAIERDDLIEYINIFGYKEKYGIRGERLSQVQYFPQTDRESMAQPENILPRQCDS